MRVSRRQSAFTLVEAMIVVAIVGVLALLAVVAYRRWVRTAYLAEAQDMVANIRSAEESFRAENGGYLNVSNALGPGNDFPAATPGKFKTAWNPSSTGCGVCSPGVSWSSLNVHPSGPLLFGYSLIANNGHGVALPAVTVNGAALDVSAIKTPWYFIEADGDEDGNGVFTRVFADSATNQIFVDNEGE